MLPASTLTDVHRRHPRPIGSDAQMQPIAIATTSATRASTALMTPATPPILVRRICDRAASTHRRAGQTAPRASPPSPASRRGLRPPPPAGREATRPARAPQAGRGRHWQGEAWGDWYDMPSPDQLVDIAAGITSRSRFQVVAVGFTGKLWQRTYVPVGNWSAWELIYRSRGHTHSIRLRRCAVRAAAAADLALAGCGPQEAARQQRQRPAPGELVGARKAPGGPMHEKDE